MKHLKLYKIFENNSSSGLDQEQISFLDGITNKWTYDESTGLVDVDGDFVCSHLNLEDFKGVNFGTIRGDFKCSNNNLTSMEGMPKYIQGSFNCGNNKIKSLIGSPVLLKKENHYSKNYDVDAFTCYSNKIESFEGLPDLHYYKLDISDNLIESLEGAPKKLQDFNFGFNLIKTLEGSPEITGSYHCSHLKITSLKGAPEKLTGNFYCSYNKGIKSLEGGPSEAHFYVAVECDLDNLRGGPKKVMGLDLERNMLTTLEDIAGIITRDPIDAKNNPVSEDLLRITAEKEWLDLTPSQREDYYNIEKMGLI